MTRSLRLFVIRRALRKEVAGRTCFVMGSAPEPDIEGMDKDAVLICVNGSGANAARLGLKSPVITVVDFELLDSAINTKVKTRSVIIKNDLLRGLNLGLLLATQSNYSNGGSPACLNASYKGGLKLYKTDCRSIVHKVTRSNILENDVHGLLSRGGLTLAICVWGGAKKIIFSGFSLFKHKDELNGPHYYASIEENFIEKDIIWAVTKEAREMTDNWDTRNHSLADSTLIGMLVLNGHDISSSSKDFAVVLSNWGKNPPEWVMLSKKSIWKRFSLIRKYIS